MSVEQASRSFWVDDKYATRCFCCSKRFGFVRRKHHCRSCGQVFCADCLQFVAVSSKSKAEKVCKQCEKNRLTQGRKLNDSRVRDRTLEDTQTPLILHGFHESVVLAEDELDEDSDVTTEAESPCVTSKRKFVAIDEVSSPMRQSATTPFYFHDPVIKSSPFEEEDPNPMKYDWIHEETAAERSVIYCSQEIPLPSKCELNDWANALLHSTAAMSRTFTPVPRRRKKIYVPSSSVTFSFEPMSPSSSNTKFDPQTFTTCFKGNVGSHPILEMLQSRAIRHLLVRCHHLIHESNKTSFSEGRIDPDVWSEVICDLSWRAVSQTLLGKSQHILNNIDVLSIPNGSISDTEIVPGISFMKNVTHKSMRTRIECPRVLLLGGEVGAPTPNMTVDLVEYTATYPGWLDKLYSRILVWKPHLILVEKSMHHFMQQKVIKDGMTLVTHVSRDVLDKLERSIDAHIVDDLTAVSISDVSEGSFSPTGTCSSFRVTEVEGRPIVTLSGFPRPCFTTMILRGGSLETLASVSRVLQACISVAFHLTLQTHYFLDFDAVLASSMESDTMTVSPRTLGMNMSDTLTSQTELLKSNESITVNMGVVFPQNVFEEDQQTSGLGEHLLRDNISITAILLESQKLAGGGESDAWSGGIERQLRTYPFYGDETLWDFLTDRMNEGDSSRLLVHGNRRIFVKAKTDGRDPSLQQSPEAALSRVRRSVYPPLGFTICKECRSKKMKFKSEPKRLSQLMMQMSFGAFLELTIYASAGCICHCGHNFHNDVMRCFVLYPSESVIVTITFDVEPLKIFNVSGPPLLLPQMLLPSTQLHPMEVLGDLDEEREQTEETESWSPLSLYASMEKVELEEHLRQIEAFFKEVKQSESDPPAASPTASGTQTTFLATSLRFSHTIGHSQQALQSLQSVDEYVVFRHEHLNPCFEELSALCTGATKKKIQKTRSDGWAFCANEKNRWIRMDEPSSMIASALIYLRKGGRARRSSHNEVSVVGYGQRSDEVLGADDNGGTSVLEPPANVEHCRVMSTEEFPTPVDTPSPSCPHVSAEESPITLKAIEPTMEDIVGRSVEEGETLRVVFRTAEEAREALSSAALGGKESTEVYRYDEEFILPDDGSKVNVIVELLFPVQFAAMRHLYSNGNSETIISSLLRCKKHNPSGGKSGSTFLMTGDERFMLKQIKQTELRHFYNFGPAYFNHLDGVFQSPSKTGSPFSSLLVKILGVFSVQTKKKARLRNVESERAFYILMENLLFRKKKDVMYDLKGSQRKRLVGEDAPVLLDENLVQLARRGFFFFLSEADKSWLEKQLQRDANLLSSNNIMDYSLIVAVDASSSHCTVGIIDYLHPYSVEKVIESKVKTGMENIFGSGNKDPTIIEPVNYKGRFLKWIGCYFCGVPDKVSYMKKRLEYLRRKNKSIGGNNVETFAAFSGTPAES